MVARGRRVHDQLVAGTRPHAFTEHLRRRNRPGDTFKGFFRRPRGVPCVRVPPTRCSISTNDSDSSKTEHCLSQLEASENMHCVLASNDKWIVRDCGIDCGSRPFEDVGPIVKLRTRCWRDMKRRVTSHDLVSRTARAALKKVLIRSSSAKVSRDFSSLGCF